MQPVTAGAGRIRRSGSLVVACLSAWPAIAHTLASQRCNVIADCGRLDAGDGQPASVLARAELVAIVIRASLRQVAAARPRIEILAQLRGGLELFGLLLVGGKGHSPGEISSTLGVRMLGVGVLARIPCDARTAAVLSDGVGRRGSLDDRPLLRAGRAAGQALADAAARWPEVRSGLAGADGSLA